MAFNPSEVLNLLTQLSKDADEIIFVPRAVADRERDWCNMVVQTAQDIVNTDQPPIYLPGCVSFVRGRYAKQRQSQRISSLFMQMKRDHLHQNSNVDGQVKDENSEAENNSAEITTIAINRNTGKTSIKKTFATSAEAEEIVASTSGTTEGMDGQKKRASNTFFTPKNKTQATPVSSKGAKRKSSSDLSAGAKKPKIAGEPSLYKSKSLKRGKKGAEKEKREFSDNKIKGVSHVPTKKSIKTSLVDLSSSLKPKDNLKSKIQKKEESVNLNLKRLISLRQTKIEENKKKREDKMEKTQQQRLKLEKEKQEKFKSARCCVENKAELKIKMKPKGENKDLAPHSEKVLPLSSGEKISAKKNLRQVATKQNQAATTSKNILEKTYCTRSFKNAIGTPVLTPGSSGIPPTPKSTPRRAHEKKKNNTPVRALDKTNLAKSKQGVYSKALKTKQPSVAKTEKKMTMDVKSLPILPKNQQPACESYALTPARSSFVSYDISERNSDDSEEEESANSKPIPSWASGVRLRNALLKQHYDPANVDELFGNQVEAPDLSALMGVKKKHYNKRTSSAVWNSPLP